MADCVCFCIDTEVVRSVPFRWLDETESVALGLQYVASQIDEQPNFWMPICAFEIQALLSRR